jgi:molybdopterin converting factor small subunit
VRVLIPSPLRSYTAGEKVVQAEGATVDELLRDLDRQFPGIRFRVVDEQDRLRTHMKVFVGQESVRDLRTPLDGHDEVTLMQALSGG